MSDEDEPNRKSSGSPSQSGNRNDLSLTAAVEASLQGVLLSLSDALGKINDGNSKKSTPSMRGPGHRPSRGKSQFSRNHRVENQPENDSLAATEPKSDECLINSRLVDDEFVITADIPGASKDDISTGINQSKDELVIMKSNSVVGRVSIPWSAPGKKKAWFNNGILEVRLAKDADPA